MERAKELRVVALEQAVTSYGDGASRHIMAEDTEDIVKRAAAFEDFLRTGQTPGKAPTS